MQYSIAESSFKKEVNGNSVCVIYLIISYIAGLWFSSPCPHLQIIIIIIYLNQHFPSYKG